MSTVLARTVAATPERSASKTWAAIVELLAPDPDSEARTELEKVKGVAISAIASEAPRSDAFIVYGGGPRVRVYCVFGEDAINGEGVNEAPLVRSVTGHGWRLSIPCPSDDVAWSQRQLAALSTRVSVRTMGEQVDEQVDERGDASVSRARVSEARIDREELFRK